MKLDNKCIAMYLRLSDEDRDQEESNSIKNQRILLREYIQRTPELSGMPVEEFVDDGYSGVNYDRPEFQRMLRKAREGKIQAILVKDLSRLGRSTIETQEYIEKVFPFLGIRLIALNDHLDTKIPVQNQNDLEIKFKNLINGLYPEMCSKNIKLQKRKSAEKGKFMGCIPIYGYAFKDGEHSKLVIDPESAKIVAQIFTLFTQGKSLGAIAKVLNEEQVDTPATYLGRRGYRVARKGNNIWYYTTVKSILKEKSYIGTIVNHRTEVSVISTKKAKIIPPEERIECENQHEAIISKDVFEQAALLLKENMSRRKRAPLNSERSIFDKKIRCGCCGNKMRIRIGPKSRRISCQTPLVSDKYGCMKGGIQEEELKQVILKMINYQIRLISNFWIVLEEKRKSIQLNNPKQKIESFENRIKELKKKRFLLYEEYAEGRITKEHYQEKTQILSDRINYYAVCKEQMEKQAEEEKNIETLQKDKHLRKIRGFRDVEQLDSKIVNSMIDTIYIYDADRIEIKWAFQDIYVEELEK
jgi:site-specific DNA recombinase